MLLGNSCYVIFNTYYIHTPSNVHYMAKNHCAKFHDFSCLPILALLQHSTFTDGVFMCGSCHFGPLTSEWPLGSAIGTIITHK